MNILFQEIVYWGLSVKIILHYLSYIFVTYIMNFNFSCYLKSQFGQILTQKMSWLVKSIVVFCHNISFSFSVKWK